MVNFGPLAAEIVSLVWGTPGNFNGFSSWQRYGTVVQLWASAKLCGVEQRAQGATYIRQGDHHILVFFLSLFLSFFLA